MLKLRGMKIPAWAILILLSMVIFLVSGKRHLRVDGDGYYHYLFLVNLFEEGNFDFTHQYQKYGHPYNDPDHPYTSNPFPPGSALLWLPTYAMTDVYFLLKGRAPVNPFDMTFQSMALSGTWIAALFTFWLAWRWLRRTYDKEWVFLALIGSVLATPYIFYLMNAPSYAHVPSAFFLTLFLYLFFVHPERTFGQGLVAGLAALTKHQSGVLIPLFLLYTVWKWRDIKGAARFLAGALIPLLPLVIYWHRAYGRWLTIPQGGGYMTADVAGIFHSIFSVRHGAVVWSPILLAAIIGLIFLAFKKDAAMRCALIFFAFMVVVNGLPRDWWGGHAFGNRRWVDLFPFIVLGLSEVMSRCAVWVKARPRRAVLLASAILVLLLMILNLGMIKALHSGRINPSMYPDASGVYGPGLEQAYRWIGNPLAYPDSLIFALRYGVHPVVYDEIMGAVLNYDANSDGPILDPGRPELRRYFYKGFRFDPEPAIVERESRIFIPLAQPETLDFVLFMDGGSDPMPVQVVFNGVVRKTYSHFSWREPVFSTIAFPEVAYGTNVLALRFKRVPKDARFGFLWVKNHERYFENLLPFGWLDSARYDASKNEVTVSGWALGRKGDVDVGVVRYPGPRVNGTHDRFPRWDVKTTHPDGFGFDRAGFESVFTPDTPPGEKIFAVLRIDERNGKSNLIIREMPVQRTGK